MIMNFQFYVEKLKSLDKYKEFMKKNKEAYPCSGFFVFDKEKNDNQQHIDFSDKGKIYSFKLESQELMENETEIKEKLSEIDLDLDFDFNDVEKEIEEEMEHKGIKNKIQKFLYSLQRTDVGHFLIGTVFISNLGMLKVSYDLDKKELVSLEKKSFFDILKVKSKKD